MPPLLQTSNPFRLQPRTNIIGTYFQDTWRVRSNFTINAGLRYEMMTIPTNAGNGFGTIAESDYPSPAAAGGCPNTYPTFFPLRTTTVRGCPIPLDHLWASNPTLRNFAPRIGLAWDPFNDGKTSIRAGFGIYDVLTLPSNTSINMGEYYPNFQASAVSS